MEIFSPNMLKTFEECPRKYEFRYVQNISAPQKSTPFEKGKKIHALANYYLRNENVTRLEQALTQEEKFIWEILKDNEYFKKTYVQSEYNLSFKLGDYWIGGRIDAIVKDENQYYILDYKTGSIPNNPEFDFQTMVYLLAASKFFKAKCSFVYINLKQNTNYKIDLNEDLMKVYEKKIFETCNSIKQTTTFKRSQNCKFCEFSTFC